LWETKEQLALGLDECAGMAGINEYSRRRLKPLDNKPALSGGKTSASEQRGAPAIQSPKPITGGKYVCSYQ